MSAKEYWKVVFSDEKKFNLDGQDGFQKYWRTQKISRSELLNKAEWRMMSYDLGAFSSSEKLNLRFVSDRQKAADYVKSLNDLSLAQEGLRLCGEQ